MHSKGSLEWKITLSEQAKGELNWWIHNLNSYNGECLITLSAQLMNKLRCFKPGLRSIVSRAMDGGHWSKEERRKSLINKLELKAAKLAIMTFTMPHQSCISIHLRLDNIATLSYLLIMSRGEKLVHGSSQQENLGLPLASQNCHYNGLPPRADEI